VKRRIGYLPQVRDAFPPRGDNGDDCDTELANQLRDVDAHASCPQAVNAIECDDRWTLEFDELTDKEEISLQILGVDDDDNNIRSPCCIHASEQHVVHDGFVGRVRGQTVATRKIDNRDALAVSKVFALDPLNSNSREIRYALTKTGECVE